MWNFTQVYFIDSKTHFGVEIRLCKFPFLDISNCFPWFFLRTPSHLPKWIKAIYNHSWSLYFIHQLFFIQRNLQNRLLSGWNNIDFLDFLSLGTIFQIFFLIVLWNDRSIHRSRSIVFYKDQTFSLNKLYFFLRLYWLIFHA